MLQEGRLEIPARMPQAEALVRELAEMRVKALPSGSEQFGAQNGEHERRCIWGWRGIPRTV
jgi:hypothetical protein